MCILPPIRIGPVRRSSRAPLSITTISNWSPAHPSTPPALLFFPTSNGKKPLHGGLRRPPDSISAGKQGTPRPIRWVKRPGRSNSPSNTRNLLAGSSRLLHMTPVRHWRTSFCMNSCTSVVAPAYSSCMWFTLSITLLPNINNYEHPVTATKRNPTKDREGKGVLSRCNIGSWRLFHFLLTLPFVFLQGLILAFFVFSYSEKLGLANLLQYSTT